MSAYLPLFTTPQGEAAVKEAYAAVLARWTAPYTEQMVPTRFGDVHVIASGPAEAPPVVLLHAYFATAAVWYPNAGALAEKYRVYAVDILGEANLSRPVQPVVSLDEVAEWVTELFDALQIGKADLVGNSFGGFLAASLAMLIPERVRSIVMIGPAATFHQIMPFYLNLFLPKFVNLMVPGLPGHAGRMRHSVDWMHAGLAPDGCWEQLFYQVMLHGTATNRLFPKVYGAEDFRKIQAVPALLLIGDHEKIYRPQDTLAIARRNFPSLETEIIPNAHHITALANPEAVNRRILDFLETQA